VNFNALGGRRFLLTVATQISTTVLVWAGKISDDVFSVVIIATVGVYIAGNTTEKIKAPAAPEDNP
jgi:hypothetical protein